MKYGFYIPLFFLVGCTTTSPNFVPVVLDYKKVNTNVYIYSDCDKSSNSYAVGGTVGPAFSIGKNFIGYLAPDSYIPLVLNEGKYAFKLSPTWNYTFIPELKFDFDVHGGGTKYLRYKFDGTNVSNNLTRFESLVQEVPVTLALSDISNCQINKSAYAQAINKNLSK